MNNCNIPENLANRYGLATIGYIYDVNGTDVFNELNDYIKFHNIDYNTDDMFSVYNPSIFMPQYYNKYGYWMMLFKLEHEIPLTSFEKTIYNVKFDNNIDTLRDDYINKRVYSDPTFNSNVKKDENVNILYRKIENKVYGFITPDNIIYLDKDSLNNPNTMFHEFYHLYDKILVNNSDESTQAYSIITRANELIVESGHLNEVQNDINYKHLSLELQQIEARARMIGDYAENKFNNNKISKLVNDIIEYIKSLFDKGTFDDYSNDEILKMNIVDFNDIVINEMINNDESIVSKDLNKVLLNKLKSVFKPYYKEVTFDKNKANSIRKEYEKRADIIYLNQVILDNITNNEYNIVEGSNWNLPYDNKLILDLLNSGDIEAINTLTKIIINDNPQLSDINIDNNDLIKYVAYNLNGDDIELLLSLDLNDKEFNDFIIERNKKRIYNNTKHFYISVANNYNKYLEYNKLRNDETFKELYDNIDNNSILTPENSLYLYSIFNKEFKNKKEITQELNKYNIYKNYANSIQAMFIKEIEKNPNLDLNEVANNLFDNNNIKILNDNVNYFESRYPIWTNYVDIIPSTNIKLTNSTLNDILSVYTGELYFNDLLNYKGNISFNLTNILNKRIIDLFETDEMENDYIKNNVVSLVGNEIMNNAKFRNDIQSLFNKSMNKNISYGINFGVNGEYYKGLQNVRDFVTESLTNERFISYLKSLNVLEDVYNRIDFYTNINTQTNNLERNKEILQEKYQELIKLDVLLRNVNSDTIVELNDNNLVIDDNIVNLNDVGFRLTNEDNDNIVDILNKFSNKVLKEFSEFDYIIQNDVNINESQQSSNNFTVKEIEANRTKEIEEFVTNIFPETVVKQVVYHGTTLANRNKIIKNGFRTVVPGVENLQGRYGAMFGSKQQAELRAKQKGEQYPELISTIINSVNPIIIDFLKIQKLDSDETENYDSIIGIVEEKTIDSLVENTEYENQRESFKYEYIIFEPEQIHILTEEELSKIDEINTKYDKMLEELNNSNEEIIDKDKIDYQLKDELESKLVEGFLKDFNITVAEYNSLKKAIGFDAKSASDIITKSIAYEKGESILPEVAYFAYTMLGKQNNKLRSELRYLIYKWDKYKERFEFHTNTIKDKEGFISDKKEWKAKIRDLVILDFLKEKLEDHYINPQEFEKSLDTKWTKEDFTMWNKIVALLEKLLAYFSSKYSEKQKEKLNNIGLSIADEILTQNYEYFDYNLSENQFQKYYNVTINSDAFAKDFVDYIQKELNLILTGSLALRKAGTVYRTADENLHDIDLVVPFELNNSDANKEILNKIKGYLGEDVEYASKMTLEFVEELDWYKKFIKKYPTFKIHNGFYGGEHSKFESFTLTGVIDGKYYTEKGTHEETISYYSKDPITKKSVKNKKTIIKNHNVGDLIENTGYVIDFFIRLEPKQEEHENYFKLWKEIMLAKLKMGRDKDFIDWKVFVPYLMSKDRFNYYYEGFRHFNYEDSENNAFEELDDLDESKVDYQKDDKELVDMSYELFPELNNIGSKELFQQYLNNTFENSRNSSLKEIYSKYSLFKTLSKLSGYNFKDEKWLYDNNMVFFVEDSIKGIDFLEGLYKEIQNDLHNRRKIDIYIANVAEKVYYALDKYKFNNQGQRNISNRVHQTSLHNDIFKLYTLNTFPLHRNILQAILHGDIDLPALREIVSIKVENGYQTNEEILDILENSLLNIPKEFIKEDTEKDIFGNNIKRIPTIIKNSNILSNTYYSLNKHLQLFHSFTVGVKYEDSQSIKFVLKPSIKKYIKDFRKYNNSNVEQKGNIKPTSISILNKMADDFQSRYNITFKVIRESEAMKLLDKNNVPNAFYYEPTNTAYIIEGKANEISVVHELGHAFLYKIKNDNIKLYNNLVEEARNMPEITDYVNRVYGQISKDKYEQEVIMRAIDLYNQDKLDAKENKGLIDLITEFLLSISSYIKDLLGFERIDVNIIEPDTKLKDIADLLYLYKGNMDLSTKNKTQNFTYDERQNIRNIVNGNESEGIGNIAESARNYIVRSNKTIGGGSNNIGREKELLEEFLKENPQFIYDIDENPLGTQVAAGAQSKVYMSEDDTKYVYKKSWLTAHGGILENLTSILLHNMLFNNVEYEILGFYISDDFEKYNIILKQRFVLKEQMYNYDSIVEYLTHNHFIEKNGVFNNFDLKIKVTDLHPGNVYFANNKIFFIDPIVTTIPNSRDIHLGKVLEQLPEQNEDKSITVDDFYNKYQDKVINMLDIKKIENFNKDKGYAAINVIKRNDGKYVAIKNSEKVIQSDNNFIPTYQGLLSGNNPVKFYKTGNNYNINSLSNNTFYINEPVEIDEKGNAIIQDYNNIIPTNEIKTIINERFKDNNDYYVNNLLKDIKLSNYLTSEEADRYAEYIKNVNVNRNQKYVIDIIDNKGFKKLNIMMESDNIVNINDNFSPTTVKAIEDKGLNIEEMNNPLLLSLQSLITNGELSEELTCKI